MLKHLLVGALAASSVALARPPELPRSPPASPQVERRSRPDDLRAAQLLRAYDAAAARRDVRAMAVVARQFDEYLAQALREARRDAHGDPRARRTVDQLSRIAARLDRLQGRGRGAAQERRDLYAELVRLAERDGRGGRWS